MINNALPPSLDLVVSPTFTNKDSLVKAPPTCSDNVTREVEDDFYSIPNKTSSIQELINNNNRNDNYDDGFESMPFSIGQFINESPSAKKMIVFYDCFPFSFLLLLYYFLHNSRCMCTCIQLTKNIHAWRQRGLALDYEPHPCVFLTILVVMHLSMETPTIPPQATKGHTKGFENY